MWPHPNVEDQRATTSGSPGAVFRWAAVVLAVVLVGMAGFAAASGFWTVALLGDDTRMTARNMQATSVAHLGVALLMLVGGLLLWRWVSAGRVLAAVFTAAYVAVAGYGLSSGFAFTLEFTYGDHVPDLDERPGIAFCWVMIALGILLLVLLLVSMLTTRTQRPRSAQVPQGVGGQPQMGSLPGGYAYGPATPGHRIPPPPGHPYH
ncbi:hypothetical protein [Nocardia sp. NPDC050718]|uniref:hypothetical protein n=1 Tax=Nocardia sp. NPDC050718 TaxID=3155788 RepID=UPI0033CE3514